MDIVIVEWMDAYGPVVGWGELPTDAGYMLVTSMGFLIEFPETDSITLIPNYIEETKQCFGNTVIPKGCIHSMTVVAVTQVVEEELLAP